MNSEKIPPFYVGQEVEAVKDHSQGEFKSGDRFIISSVQKGCSCQWIVTIGKPRSSYYSKCGRCGYLKENNSREYYFGSLSFRALTPQFKAIKFEEIKEAELVSEN